ncbi:calcium-binding protein [Clostridium guangxiense]|uniref:calcium-binding protein n=1 Tax=Clostridium guangxiense TaxID=1662055 RepID=UPI001E59E576|nr:calcium-binding protein [Clostridium guangxiense]MCD2345866.1 calcium-binding protein [Clostridium guangxiense]
MFEVIKTECGKYITEFEFDYSGTYPDFDIFIINAKVKFYKKGFLISTSLSEKSLFIEWNDITGIKFTKNKKTLVNITTDKGAVILKREKQETDIGEFKKLLNSMVKNIKLEYVKSDIDNISSLEMKRHEKLYDMQEKRVESFIRNSGYEDDAAIQEYWCDYLKEKLQFPFEAKIIDDYNFWLCNR